MTRESDLMVPNGEYQQDGQTKTRWLKIGSVFTDTKNGETRRKLKIDCMPVGEFDGWVQCFDVREREDRRPERPARSQRQQTQHHEDDDNIPF